MAVISVIGFNRSTRLLMQESTKIKKRKQHFVSQVPAALNIFFSLPRHLLRTVQ